MAASASATSFEIGLAQNAVGDVRRLYASLAAQPSTDSASSLASRASACRSGAGAAPTSRIAFGTNRPAPRRAEVDAHGDQMVRLWRDQHNIAWVLAKETWRRAKSRCKCVTRRSPTLRAPSAPAKPQKQKFECHHDTQLTRACENETGFRRIANDRLTSGITNSVQLARYRLRALREQSNRFWARASFPARRIEAGGPAISAMNFLRTAISKSRISPAAITNALGPPITQCL